MSGFDAALKIDYLPVVRNQLENMNVLVKELYKNADRESVIGKEVQLALHSGRNTGVGAAADDGALPTAEKQDITKSTIAMKYVYGRLTVTGPTIKASSTSEGALARALEFEMKGLTADLKDKVSTFTWSTSVGADDPASITEIVSDTGTFQGIDRSAQTWWKAVKKGNSGTDRALTLALMQDAFSASEKAGADVSKLHIFTEFALRDKYAALLTADKRFVNKMQLDGGFEALEFNGRPVIADPKAVAESFFFVDMSSVGLYIMQDFDWMDKDGAILSRVANKDSYEAVLYSYYNLGAERCNVHVLLNDIINT